GNTPLEAMIFEYASLRGTTDGMDTTVISEIAEYYERELDYEIPPRTPFVGKHFNVTQAGIHADGLLKDEEIYNIFNTGKLLNKPIGIAITQTSGLAGIALWINNNFRLSEKAMIDKKDARVAQIKEWIDVQYQNGRNTSISDKEMLKGIQEIEPSLIPVKK
ncbi:MAG: 2-isopropylmalate synthase, partial [Ruminiclostridium sp.]